MKQSMKGHRSVHFFVSGSPPAASNGASVITAGRGGFMLRLGAQPGTSSSSNRNSSLSPPARVILVSRCLQPRRIAPRPRPPVPILLRHPRAESPLPKLFINRRPQHESLCHQRGIQQTMIFLLVSQFSVTGALYTCRPDLVGFVNDLPLVVIELKKPGVPARGVRRNLGWGLPEEA